MMLHSRNALSRHVLHPIVCISSATRLSINPSLSQSSQSKSTVAKAKDIFPASSPMIDEPVDQIHKRMSKLSYDFKNKSKLDPFTKAYFSTPSLEQDVPTEEKAIDHDLYIGHVVEFAHKDGFEIGYVSSVNEKSVNVATIDNQQVKIHSTQIVNVWSNEVGKVTLEQFKGFQNNISSFLETQPIRKRDITDAWKKLNIFVQVPFTSTLMSKILFNSTSPIAVYSTFKMMSASPYFRRWDSKATTGYKIYNSEGLKGTRMAKFIKKVQQKLAGEPSGAFLLPNWDSIVDPVFKDDIATFAENGAAASSKSRATAKFVLEGLKLEYTPKSAEELLQKLGAPISTETKEADPMYLAAREQAEKISAHVKQINGRFSVALDEPTPAKKGKKASKKADSVKTTSENKVSFVADKDATTREDLTHHSVVAVDTDALAADTAVSMKVSKDGRKATVYLHTADPTRWITPGDSISSYAHSVGNTLYLPNSTRHMLPKSFLESVALSGERENYSVTLALHVDAATGLLQSYDIFPSVINKVIQATYKNADRLMNEETKEGIMEESTARHVSSLLQNLNTLKQARMESAPYEEPTVALYEPDVKSVTGLSPSRHASQSFSALHYVTILADEAISKFAAANDVPLPSPPNYTRPLRNFGGMATHLQIKAALRNEELPFNNSQMEHLRSWLSQKTAKNNELVAKLRDQATQSALRTFFDRQRAVTGDADIILTAQVVKKSVANKAITISVKELRYKSVIPLSSANFERVDVGRNVSVRLRERPTHIGMAFVDLVPVKSADTQIYNSKSQATFSPKTAGANLGAPRDLQIEEPQSTFASVVRKASASRTTPISGVPRVQSSISNPVSARSSSRLYSTDNSNNGSIPAGKKIALAKVGNVGDDFSNSAAPFEPPMFDVDPEDLIPRAPRVPVPPKPSRALKSRSRSMILNPIRREEDSTPLPEGSPTHVAIPASVARAQAAAAAKAAAKEAKEAAKAAAKAAKVGVKKGGKAETTEAAKPADEPAPKPVVEEVPAPVVDTPSTDGSSSSGAAPVSTPSSGSVPPASGSSGPVGTASPSSTTTVAGAPPSANPPSHSFSTLSFLSRFRPSSHTFIGFSASPLTITRGYATGKSPVTPSPSTTPTSKEKQAPIADEEDDDDDDDDEDEDDYESDKLIEEDEEEDEEEDDEDTELKEEGKEDEEEDDEDTELKEEGKEDEEGKEHEEDEEEEDDEDAMLKEEGGEEDEDEEEEDYDEDDAEDDDGFGLFKDDDKFVDDLSAPHGYRPIYSPYTEHLCFDNDLIDAEEEETPASSPFKAEDIALAGAAGAAAAYAARSQPLASPSAQANVAPESAAPAQSAAGVKEIAKKETKEEVAPKKRGRKPKAQKEEEESVEEAPKPKGKGRGKK